MKSHSIVLRDAARTPRILVVRLSAVGDCVHAVPFIAALRQRYPAAHIGWAIEELGYSLMSGHPCVNRFHVFPRKTFKKQTGTFLSRMALLREFANEMKECRYDIAVDLQGLTKSGLVAYFSGATRRIGFLGQDSRELNPLFMTERYVTPPNCQHVVDKNLSLLRAFGINNPRAAEWPMPDYSAENLKLRPFLTDNGLRGGRGGDLPFVIINPGAMWETKRWPAERFGAVAKAIIAQTGLKVVVTWAGPDEENAAKVIVYTAGDGALMAPPTNLRELAALTARATLFIGNDTGPLHLAVASNVPSVAVFGASDPLRNGPYDPRNPIADDFSIQMKNAAPILTSGKMHRALTGSVECRPCWKKTCARGDLACLNRLDIDRVTQTCLEHIRITS